MHTFSKYILNSCPALGFLSLPNKQVLSHKSTKRQIQICSYNITFRMNWLNKQRVTWRKLQDVVLIVNNSELSDILPYFQVKKLLHYNFLNASNLGEKEFVSHDKASSMTFIFISISLALVLKGPHGGWDGDYIHSGFTVRELVSIFPLNYH